jgi:hypothetical protein
LVLFLRGFHGASPEGVRTVLTVAAVGTDQLALVTIHHIAAQGAFALWQRSRLIISLYHVQMAAIAPKRANNLALFPIHHVLQLIVGLRFCHDLEAAGHQNRMHAGI